MKCVVTLYLELHNLKTINVFDMLTFIICFCRPRQLFYLFIWDPFAYRNLFMISSKACLNVYLLVKTLWKAIVLKITCIIQPQYNYNLFSLTIISSTYLLSYYDDRLIQYLPALLIGKNILFDFWLYVFEIPWSLLFTLLWQLYSEIISPKCDGNE